MSNHYLPARGTDPPFSHKSVVSITHEQNIICGNTLICRQLLAGHLVSSRPMKRTGKIHRLIINFNDICPLESDLYVEKRFSKVPILFGSISGATSSFISSLRNAEDLSHQTSQSSWFSLH